MRDLNYFIHKKYFKDERNGNRNDWKIVSIYKVLEKSVIQVPP